MGPMDTPRSAASPGSWSQPPVRERSTPPPRWRPRTPSHAPILLISAGTPAAEAGRDLGGLHDIKDIVGAMSHLTAWSVRVSSAEHACAAIADAFAFFASERPRPVYIEVPVDVLEGPLGRPRRQTVVRRDPPPPR